MNNCWKIIGMTFMDLNEDEFRRPYEMYYGSDRSQMPALIADKRVLISTREVMERRLNSNRACWRDNLFSTGDAFMYHPDGKVKIILDSEHLLKLSPQSKLKNGALILQDGEYESAKGIEFTQRELFDLTGKGFSLVEARTHPVWRVLARDPSLHEEYTDRVFQEIKKRGLRTDQSMTFYADHAHDVPRLNSTVLFSFFHSSQLTGCHHLDGHSNLVGVARDILDNR